jgi:ligand-binding sensor domain-containing protein/signal transduction histidine kinase/DNA-binding response OmpR family regulator
MPCKFIYICLSSLLFFYKNTDQICYAQNLQSSQSENQSVNSEGENKPVFQNYPVDFDFNAIRCIFKDYKGFMWFGTGDGLVKFDGINLSVYENDPKSETSLSHNIINTIIEDKDKNLWIGTSEGLNLYNRNKDNFIRTENMKDIISKLDSRFINALLCDEAGNIWIGTYGGVYRFNKKINKLINFRDTGLQSISLNMVTSLAADKENNIWVGTQNGLNLFINEQKGFRQFFADKNNPSSLSNNNISKIFVDDKGIIWIGTSGGGLNRIIRAGQDYKFKNISNHTLPSGLSNDYIISLASDISGNLWIGTDNGGLNRLNILTDQIDVYKVIEGDEHSINSNSIWSLFIDNEERLWIGTNNKGINVIDNKLRKFEFYQKNRFNKNSLPDDDVRGFTEDKNGNIWIATDGGGVCKFEPVSRKISIPNESKLTNNAAQCIICDPDNHLWVGTWGGGIDKLDNNGKILKNYKLETDSGFGNNNIFNIISDSDGNIWAGTAGSGLFIYDKTTDNFIAVKSNNNSTILFNSAYITSLVKDSENTIWVGSLNGLLKVKKVTGNILETEDIFHSTDPSSISSNRIEIIFIDSKNRLWLGTTDNGLNLYNKNNNSFTIFLKKDGLSGNYIMGIQEDKEGHLWISTNKGLTRFNYPTLEFTNYSKDDGLNTNEFYMRSFFKSKKGEFYLGGEKGFNVFNADKIKNNSYVPSVYLTDFKINNKSVEIGGENSPLQKQISETNEVTLSYNQSSFSIDFIAINYTRSTRNQYCYKLQGFEDEWNCLGNRRSAIYTNIKPGKYVFLVKGSNNDGIWNEIPTKLTIVIKPPLWERWWAKISYLILIAGITIVIFNFLKERIRIKNQLKLEQMAREKEHELNEQNIQFFTNISHEFRTPLSLIIAPLEKIISSTQPEIKESISVIYRNAQRLLQLTNKLMDFRKLEGGIIKLKVEYGEILSFIKEVTSYFIDDSKRRNINMIIKSDETSVMGWFDPDKIETILLNLLSNSFKNIPDNSSITISVSCVNEIEKKHLVQKNNLNNESQYIEISVIDNGIGIPSEELPFIFEKFYRTKTSEVKRNSGTGIGLALVKGLVESLHGTISVRSIPDNETCFTVVLPINISAFHENELVNGSMNLINDFKSDKKGNNLIIKNEDYIIETELEKAEILIVEDNEELRKFLSDELKNKFIVKEAKDGNQGINIALSDLPDLIISDIIMPGRSGYDLCKTIKSDVRTSHIPVILLTAKADIIDQIEGIESGADIYLTKPFNIQFLLAQINQLIRTRRELYALFSQDIYLMPNKITENEMDQKFLQRIVDYIVLNIMDNSLNVEGLANHLGLSRSNVYRKIKSLTGKTIIEFIRIVRLKQSIRLMEAKKFTLAEIAYQTGFTSPAYFTKSFKEQFGKPPSEYLKNKAG